MLKVNYVNPLVLTCFNVYHFSFLCSVNIQLILREVDREWALVMNHQISLPLTI